jgi:cytochrome b subunit of formate dehydrogenase
MNKAKLNYIIDAILGILFLIVFVTGVLKLPVLNLYKVIPLRQTTMLHDVSGVLFGVFIIVHLILHWNWIKCMTKSIFKRDNKCKK